MLWPAPWNPFPNKPFHPFEQQGLDAGGCSAGEDNTRIYIINGVYASPAMKLLYNVSHVFGTKAKRSRRARHGRKASR